MSLRCPVTVPSLSRLCPVGCPDCCPVFWELFSYSSVLQHFSPFNAVPITVPSTVPFAVPDFSGISAKPGFPLSRLCPGSCPFTSETKLYSPYLQIVITVWFVPSAVLLLIMPSEMSILMKLSTLFLDQPHNLAKCRNDAGYSPRWISTILPFISILVEFASNRANLNKSIHASAQLNSRCSRHNGCSNSFLLSGKNPSFISRCDKIITLSVFSRHG